MSRAWLCWAALGWGCQNRSNMENARRGPTVPTVPCFQVGVADCKVCLLPSRIQEVYLQIPTLTYTAPEEQTRQKSFLLL